MRRNVGNKFHLLYFLLYLIGLSLNRECVSVKRTSHRERKWFDGTDSDHHGCCNSPGACHQCHRWMGACLFMYACCKLSPFLHSNKSEWHKLSPILMLRGSHHLVSYHTDNDVGLNILCLVCCTEKDNRTYFKMSGSIRPIFGKGCIYENGSYRRYIMMPI